MNRTLSLTLAAMLVSTALADITVKVNPVIAQPEYEVRFGYVAELNKPRMERADPTVVTMPVEQNKFKIKTLPDGMSQYLIPMGNRQSLMIYAMPDDDIVVSVDNNSPLSYKASGSVLMDEIAKLDNASAAVAAEYIALAQSGTASDNQLAQLDKKYASIFENFITANPNAPAVPYAILHLDGQSFLDAYDNMTAATRSNPLAVILDNQKTYVERQMASEKRMEALQSGGVIAPDFTFNNVEGKPVSLSDFRGKWVIIDFWGTWCPWCIKGFPALKQAYADYQPKLEVLGVACNDKFEAWKNGLVKYDLPWVNVYNPDPTGGKILQDYAVEGFPTKVLVNPEGKIAKIVVGEDPSFFEILKEMIK